MDSKGRFTKGDPRAGRPKGRQSDMVVAQKAVSARLLAAWNKSIGEEEEQAIIKAAVTAAKDGDFSPLTSLWPYIARKMPDTLEVTHIDPSDLDEIEQRWSKRQDK